MIQSDTEIAAVIAELKVAQEEVQTARAQGLFDSERPLLRVLKVELLARVKTIAGQTQQLRWLLQEVLEKETDGELLKTLRLLREQGTPTMVEQVEAIVKAKSDDQKAQKK